MPPWRIQVIFEAEMLPLQGMHFAHERTWIFSVRSIDFFDSRFPVKTIISEQEDCIRYEGWCDDGTRTPILEKYLDMPLKQVVYAKETHSGSIRSITPEHPEGIPEYVDERYAVRGPGGYDAVVTAVPGVLIGLRTADCLPLFLYDPANHAVAMAHNGWRGVCSGIAGNTIEVMKKCFGSDPGDIVAAVGPCICGNCYEVGEELLDFFAERYGQEEVKSFFIDRPERADESGRTEKTGPRKYSLDIKKAVWADLEKAGIKPENFFDSGICSFENEHFASYRRDGRYPPERQTLTGIVLC